MAHGFKGHLVGEDGSRGKINDLIDLVDLQISPAVPVVSKFYSEMVTCIIIIIPEDKFFLQCR